MGRFLAEGVGFEPTSDVSRCRFSRPVPSTARPPLRLDNYKGFLRLEAVNAADLQTDCKHWLIHVEDAVSYQRICKSYINRLHRIHVLNTCSNAVASFKSGKSK